MPTTLSEKIRSGYYMGSDLRRPEKPKSTFASRASGRHAKDMEKYKADLDEYRRVSRQREAEFKADLFEEYDVTGHPKADRAFALAWEEGHANGFYEVESFFSRLVLLIRD